jgi:hydroxymethylpyrimidine/phosphomethylpyrimidine kinase
VDILWTDGEIHRFTSERIATPHTHGTGCVYSAAITARLAQGDELPVAVQRAKRFVTQAIRTNPGLGHGLGPTNLFVDTED